MTPNPKRTPPYLALLLAWSWAGLPLAWGVWQTLRKAAALFA